MVIGVEDADNEILGVDFFDDSKIQNLVNAYLEHPPQITYENVLFPHLAEGKVVGLVTIRSSGKICSLRKNIWKYFGGMVFFREGSISLPVKAYVQLRDLNSGVVAQIEKNARNNIELTLDGVIDFINHRHSDLHSYYKVFKEQFVVCWAGNRKLVGEDEYFSRVDIELINEQVKMFYSTLDEVSIHLDPETFQITEYVYLGLGGQKHYFPLEKISFLFADNGTYQIQSELIFQPPQYDRKTLHHVMNTNKALLGKLEKGISLSKQDLNDILRFPATSLICYLNGFEEALLMMQDARKWLRAKDKEAYASLKEALRILRKVRYN
jgi:hypothetical protein